MLPTILLFLCILAVAAKAFEVDFVLTTHDKKSALTKMPSFSSAASVDPAILASATVISVDESLTYQSILGIGSSLESSTAFNMMKLSETSRQALLKKLFAEGDEGIGFNLMRITIGTSDFCTAPYYSYDDLEVNQTDVSLSKFSTIRDEEFIVPSIQAAIACCLYYEIV